MENEVLTSAVCPTCGAPLKVIDEEKGTMQCEYCGGTSIDNRHTFSHVTRDFASELEYQLTNAEALIDSEFYDKAFNAYYSLIQNHGADWRVWWGLLRSRTQNFRLVDVNDDLFKTAQHYYNTAMKHIPDDKKKECTAEYEKWQELVFAYNKAIADAYNRYRLGRKIIGFVFFALTVAFVVFYRFYSLKLYETFRSDGLTAIGYSMGAIAIFTFVIGVAAAILRAGYINVYMNLTSLCCAILLPMAEAGTFEAGFEQIKEDIWSAVFVWLVLFLVFQFSTLISRIPAKIAKNRS